MMVEEKDRDRSERENGGRTIEEGRDYNHAEFTCMYTAYPSLSFS
jgi:hypothetical protein